MDLDTRIQKLESMYQSPSLLSGEEKVAESAAADPLAARIDHLDPMAQTTIRELSAIQQGHPICAYVSVDGLRAGIVCAGTVKENRPDVLKRFSQLFFSIHHSDICVVFQNELREVGRRYGK